MAGPEILNANDHIAIFRAKVEKLTHQAICGRSYILVETLTKWLRSDALPGRSWAALLLDDTYRSSVGLPVSPRKVCDDRTCSLLVFSVLLEIGHGRLIDRFQRNGILDSQLPIDHRRLWEFFESQQLPNARQLADQFNDRQSAFCPVKFDLHQGQDCETNHIIPVCQKEEIKTGGTAKVYMITVQKEFVEQPLRDIVAESGFNNPEDNFGYRYQFALKTFEEDNVEQFRNEVKAFQALEEHDGMVRYLTDYVHSEAPGDESSPNTAAVADAQRGSEIRIRKTYNIVLEYGELDLDEFFGHRLPPVLPHEIGNFWNDMFEVADAVRRIHDFEKARGGGRQKYCGWHADIKPENILSVRGRLKLADLGFARVVENTDRDKNTNFFGGTRTYGPPECFHGRGSLVHIPRAIDIWSLGCVFSIAATWVVLGWQGIIQFNQMRARAIDKIVEGVSSQPMTEHRATVLARGDYFHGGDDVLDDVLSWHKVLRTAMRRTDTVTVEVLNLVDREMLKGAAKDRVGASDLCKKLNAIPIPTQAELGESLPPESIVEALLQVDEESLSEPLSQRSPTRGMPFAMSRNRSFRRSQLKTIPSMKTSHRSEFLKSALAVKGGRPRPPTIIYENSVDDQFPSTQGPPSQGLGIDEDFDDPPMTSEFDLNPAGFQEPPPTRLTRHNIGPSATMISSNTTQEEKRESIKPQNVFQARADIERRTNRLTRRTPRDDLLSRHFKKRDIRFLIDNAWSMQELWDEASFLLETLVLKATGQDEDGMDMSFTSGKVKVEGKNGRSKFKKAMDDPLAKPMFGTRTDINESLGDILYGYLHDAKRRSYKPLKKLTIIVLTDGKFDGMTDKQDVDSMIIKFLKELEKEIGSLQVRSVSIEFVQFGSDADATMRLRRLDDSLIGVPDAVDTEPSNGDVNKMLLGSFVPDYDKRDENRTSIITPPESPQGRVDQNETKSPRGTTEGFQPFFPSEEAVRTSPPQIHALPYRPSGVNPIQRSRSTHGPPPSLAEPFRSNSLLSSRNRRGGGKDVQYNRA